MGLRHNAASGRAAAASVIQVMLLTWLVMQHDLVSDAA